MSNIGDITEEIININDQFDIQNKVKLDECL